MHAVRIPTWAILFGVLVLATIYGQARAEPPAFTADGWHTWRVQAAGDSARCCGVFSNGRFTASGCNLDTGRTTRGCGEIGASDTVQVYVRSESGTVTAIRALSPQCPVESKHEIHDLGTLDNADSVARLTPYLRSQSGLGEDAIAAIAAHAGPEAFAALRALVEDRELSMAVREQALFWLVEAEADDRFAYVEHLITGD